MIIINTQNIILYFYIEYNIIILPSLLSIQYKYYCCFIRLYYMITLEQAEIVKRIYHEYLEGYSMDKIATGLEADGILTSAGKPRWHTSTINKILRNEKYIGDTLLQKTYITDFLNKTRVKNTGIVP